ncbi:MAG: hypothetical protein ABFS45_15340 [Pseudomonadota bacterium]
MNKFVVFLPVLLLVSTQLAAEPPLNPPPIEVDAFVVNDEANPVPVIGVVQIIDPATVAFQATASCSLGGGSGCGSDIFTVPLGKRAVVEYASVVASMPVETGVGVSAQITTTLDSVEVSHQLYSSEVSPISVMDGRRGMTAGQLVRVYADPETTIRMNGGTRGPSTPGINVSVDFSISGYLVDMP